MKYQSIRFGLSLFIFSVFIHMANGQMYDWRGPDRTGIYNETGLLKKWPAAGPELLWEVEDIGFGYSSVTISDDAIYISGRKDSLDVLTALSFNGTKKWEVVYGDAWIRNHTGTRCTPTYVNGKIYLVSGAGDIVCVDKNGKIVWSKNHYKLYNARAARFGISESPLYVDNKIIVSPGGGKASLVAFDASNGDLVWEAEALNENAHYVNPKLVKHGGKKIIVSNLDTHIFGIDASNGKILWKINYDKQNEPTEDRLRKNHAMTPLYRDGKILVANGYKFIAVQIELSKDGNEASVIWKNNELGPHHGGAVLIGDYIYSTSYMSNSMGDWICVDWNTGETQWKTRWRNKGSIISADNMLYLFEEKSGHVALANINPEKLDIVSEFKISKGEGPYWAHPVIRDGKLYIRHGEVLMVYSLKK